MFENLSYLSLQEYWWFLVSLLGAILVFLMFVQGGQTLFYTLGKTDTERTILINAIGRKWEFTFTTLVTFGGAFFASFPLFYSTSFGGAYWVWMIILFAFVIQAISYEFRSKIGNLLGKKTYEIMLFINGLIGTIFIGTAVATFFTGANFTIDVLNHMQWNNPWHGVEAAFNLHNLSLGLSVFFLARVLALLYFINSIDHQPIIKRIKKQLWINTIPFLLCFLSFIIVLFCSNGYDVNTEGVVSFEKFKYFNNLIEMPVIGILFLVGVLLVLSGIISSLIAPRNSSIWLSGIGTVFTVLALFLIAGLNNTAFYPSLVNIQDSLTIQKASSSKFTLVVMSYVSLLIPFVLLYIFYTWRAINNKKIDLNEIKENHNY